MSFFSVRESQKTAFGEESVAESTPVVQVQFPYNVNTRILEARDNNGTSSVANNMLQCSTGAAANQSSQVLSRQPIKYNPGQGGLIRCTALFTSGAANSTQYIGVGDVSDGYFFGFNGAAFGVMRRQGGSPEVRTFEVTTGSSDAEGISITLDGDADAVTVTNTADTTLTANEIAAHDYSDLGQGWDAHVMGSTVTFVSYNAASQAGTYSIAATSAAGTFGQAVAGAASVETVVAQTAWSEDVMDGSGSSGITLNLTQGNVYQIRYQWLGFGAIEFSLENPSNGDLILVHRIEYANANTVPSVDNPTLPLCVMAKNTSNTSDIVIKTGSMAGFIEGRPNERGVPNNITAEDTSIGTTETPIFSIHNHNVFQSVINRVEVRPTLLSASIDAATANKPATFRVRLNPNLTGAGFSALDASTSVVHTDTSATAVSGGTVVFAQSITEGSAPVIDLSEVMNDLEPTETLTVSLEASSSTVDSVISLGWRELF